MDPITVIKELATGGFATFLIAILIAGRYRIWIWGYYLDDIIKIKDVIIERERTEKNEWRALALNSAHLTERSVSLAAKAVQVGP